VLRPAKGPVPVTKTKLGETMCPEHKCLQTCQHGSATVAVPQKYTLAANVSETLKR
jgi:hypothetical protein